MARRAPADNSEVYPLPQVELESQREDPDVVGLLAAVELQAAAEKASPSTSAADGGIFEEEVSFECTVDRHGGKLGLKVDFWVCCIQILTITDGGSADRYNEEAREERRLRGNDLLTRVNGESAVESMKERLLSDRVLTITVVRPRKMLLRLQRGGVAQGEGDVTEESAGSSWGARLRHQQNISSCLHVAEVVPGVIEAYNARAAPELQIQRHDFIERVNNTSGVSVDMSDELKRARSVELVVLRASELSGAAA